MKRLWNIAAVLALSGCASVADFRPYAPAVEVRDPKAYEADLAACRGFAAAYSRPLDLAAIGSAAASGGLGNLPSAAASPLAVALGAGGSAGAEATSELGLSSADKRKIVAICMHDHGAASGAYHVYDPNL